MLEVEKRDFSIMPRENKFSSIGTKSFGEEILKGNEKKLHPAFASSLKDQIEVVNFRTRNRSLDNISKNCISGFNLELEKLPKDKCVRVLDVGCGEGNAVQELQEKYPEWEIHGIDLSPDKKGNKTGAIIGGEASLLPYRSNKFDLVYSAYTYSYFPDKIKAVSEIQRVTKPGGVIMVQGLPGNVYEQVESSRVEELKANDVYIHRKYIGNKRQFFKKITVVEELKAIGVNAKITKYGDANIHIQKSSGDDERIKKLPFRLINNTVDPHVAGFDHIDNYYIREPLIGKSIA